MSEGKKVKAFAQETVYDVLSCKEGSVYGNEYTENTAWSGSANADAGRPELGMEFYQQFDDCFYTFDEVRFLGFFNYWDEVDESWIYCHERGEMDEDFNMTKPVTFTIGIYEEGEDGLPGKCVLQKDIDIIGEKTGVVLEGYGDEGDSPIYEFKAPLGQTINLEHGYIQINAKDMGDRTPAISWLGTDKKSMEVAAGSEGKLNVSFTPQGLEEGVYEAYLEVSTNDPFNSFIRIPVYMVNGELTAIGSVEQDDLGITLNGGNVTIKSGKTIATLKVSDLTGRCLMTSKPAAEEATVDLSRFAKGVYVITATYADGKSVSVKVPALN